MASKRWRELSKGQRTGLAALASVELALTTAAAVDLSRRGRGGVRGGRAAWWLLIFVQPVGPLAYLLWGRHGRVPSDTR